MAISNKNKTSRKSSGSRIATVIIVTIIVAAVSGYFFYSLPQKSADTRKKTEAPLISPVPVPPTPQQSTHREQTVHPTKTVVPEINTPGVGDRVASARLAIIIDDMGNSMAEARSLASIGVPLTYAIIPGLRVDKEVAAYAATQEIETMIHVPMQSRGWPARRLEANGLLVTMDEDEIKERMSGFVNRFPGALGVNNHMGSEFTEHKEKMMTMLQALKKSNLFFIDSVTSSESTGIMAAQQAGIRSARRNVFLDNEQNRNYIVGQLNQAIRLAKKNGSAIAICHPHAVTIATLAETLPELAGQGIALVPASQLVK